MESRRVALREDGRMISDPEASCRGRGPDIGGPGITAKIYYKRRKSVWTRQRIEERMLLCR